MSSNYPPGVTGLEPEIAGPLWEKDVQRYCPECDEIVDGVVEGYLYEANWWHGAKDGIHEQDVTDEYIREI